METITRMVGVGGSGTKASISTKFHFVIWARADLEMEKNQNSKVETRNRTLCLLITLPYHRQTHRAAQRGGRCASYITIVLYHLCMIVYLVVYD